MRDWCRSFWGLGLLGLMACSKPSSPAEPIVWQCPVFYEPVRQIWHRSVVFEVAKEGNNNQLTLSIDGITPYGFALDGDRLSTNIDSERIALNLNLKTWHSQLRDLAQGSGQCSVQITNKN